LRFVFGSWWRALYQDWCPDQDSNMVDCT
jgi:hypothetical protein